MLLFSYIMPLNQTIFLVIKFVEMQSMKNGELLFFFSLSLFFSLKQNSFIWGRDQSSTQAAERRDTLTPIKDNCCNRGHFC